MSSGAFLNESEGEVTLAFYQCESKSGFGPITSPGQPKGTIVTSALKATPVYLDANHTEIGLLLAPPPSGVFAEYAGNGGAAKFVVTGSVIVTLEGVGPNVSFSEVAYSTNGPQQVEEAGPTHELKVSINQGPLWKLSFLNSGFMTMPNEVEVEFHE